MFTLQLDCWRIEKGLGRKRSVKPATGATAREAAPKPKPAQAKAEMPKPRASGRKSTVSAVADSWRPQQQRRSLCRSLCSSSIGRPIWHAMVARRAQSMTENPARLRTYS